MNWPLTESEETMVYFNKSIHWVWRAFIQFFIYILPKYVYILCNVKLYILCMYSIWENLNHVKAKRCTGCSAGKSAYYIANITSYIWLTLAYLQQYLFCENICCHAVQSNSICLRDSFSTVISNGFDFPILLKNMCMSGKECFYRIARCCYNWHGSTIDVLQLQKTITRVL